MRRDKQGHAWKWQGGSGYGFCPFCGVERSKAGFRSIGSGAKRESTMPQCSSAVGATLVYKRHRLTVVGIHHAWPPRFECRLASRKVLVPAMAYWRARRAK